VRETVPTWGGWDVTVRDDPFPLFAALRSRCAVQQVRLADGHDAWLVLSHAGARQALNDPHLSKDMVAALDEDPDVVDEGLPGPAFSRHMLNVDPPVHTRLRRLVAPTFLPSRVAALEPAVQRIADELLDQLEARGSGPVVDLVEGFAHPLPFRVICEVLGVPGADRAALHDWFGVLFRPWAGKPPPEAMSASAAIVSYLRELVDAKRAAPGDDLVSFLVAAGDERMNAQELLSSLFQLVVAGHDTTTSLIGNGVVALLDHPDQLRSLRGDLDQLPAAVEELLRFSAPVPHATFRRTTEPVEIDGTWIPARQQVLVCLGSANRDPAAFPDPDLLDIHRPARTHLSFGHGIHFCLGATLARVEARIAFATLLGRFPRLQLAVARADLTWGHGDGLVLRGLDALPVLLGPSSRIPCTARESNQQGAQP
jgi:cytochrome P450